MFRSRFAQCTAWCKHVSQWNVPGEKGFGLVCQPATMFLISYVSFHGLSRSAPLQACRCFVTGDVPSNGCKCTCKQYLGGNFLCFLWAGLISDIIGDIYTQETTLKGWLDVVTSPGLRWINCYRTTEHGWNSSTFHSRCDFKGPTVTLIKVDKFVFGGFTDLNWGGEIDS